MGSIGTLDVTQQVKTLADIKNKRLLKTQGFIDGQWADAASGRTFELLDPATGNESSPCHITGDAHLTITVIR